MEQLHGWKYVVICHILNGTQYRQSNMIFNQPKITYFSISNQILSSEYSVLLSKEVKCFAECHFMCPLRDFDWKRKKKRVMHPHHQAQISKTTHTHMSNRAFLCCDIIACCTTLSQC